MKILSYDNSIVSLENVRVVKKEEVYETKHTSQGNKYSLYHGNITITYVSGPDVVLRVKDCLSARGAEKNLDDLMAKIYEKLEEE